MKWNLKIPDEYLIQYARHKVVCVNIVALKEAQPIRGWNGITIDARDLNAICRPQYFWKSGTIKSRRLENPRLYVASSESKFGNLPPTANVIAASRLEGFKINTYFYHKKGIWEIEPIYEEYLLIRRTKNEN